MKKIFTLIAVAAMALSANAQTATVWNFSDWELGDIDANTVKDGLTLTANSDAKFTIDSSKKTVSEVAYTQRLKTGGTGTFTEGGDEVRTIKFSVAGNSIIEMVVCSASGSEDRTVNIWKTTLTKDNVTTPDATVPAVAGNPVKQVYNYVGGPTTITLGSQKSGVNFYSISATNVTTGIESVKASVKAANGAIYNVAGQQVDAAYKGLVIKNGVKVVNK